MNLFFIKLIELVYKCIDSISMVFLEMLGFVDDPYFKRRKVSYFMKE